MKDLKKLTLLHSNDMHGDFLAEKVDGKLVGGVSLLSGYVQKVRSEEENVIYAISGDMFRGSLIDSEYKGISTIEIMNLLGPDVVTLGNHEVDYGLSHLLFLEKCAKFPIINSNMYISQTGTRLFRSHLILEPASGMHILFIGILTEETLSMTKRDPLIGKLVNIEEAVSEVGKICNAYRTEDIDLTVLLTHIGFEADKRLAASLDPDWGVDLIIGGHSHTYLEEPAVVNGIPIVQAAVGTDQIGRFDITIDMDGNCIDSYKWELIPITPGNCPKDKALEKLINEYKKVTDQKYERVITRFPIIYTHPARNQETPLGRIFSDILQDSLDVDVMFLGSGSIRQTEIGPIVRYQDISNCFSYDEPVYRVIVTGAQLKKMLLRVFRDEAWNGDHTEFYQFSSNLFVHYIKDRHEIVKLQVKGKNVRDDSLYSVGIVEYHYANTKDFLDLDLSEAKANGMPRKISTGQIDIYEEWLSSRELVSDPLNTRMLIE
ncbi:MAG: bifunctional metallophosphatase/5'-nucleotidase [Clostridiales bacterium]|nr:bifunctional metallophosphatase/5'-nucleotidase [Clostridiales bacterium]